MKILIAVVGLFIILIVINKLLEAYREVKKEKMRQKEKQLERERSQKDWIKLRKQWEEEKEREPVRSEEILAFMFKEVKMDLRELAVNMYDGREYFKPVRFPEDQPYTMLQTEAKESLNELRGVFPNLEDGRLYGYAREGLKAASSRFMKCLENLRARYDGARAVTFPPGVETLSDFWAYSRDEIASVTIDGNVPELGRGALKECHSLREARLPDSLKEIGEEAFSGCHLLGEIRLPRIVEMGREAFANCFNLAKVNVPGTLRAVPRRGFARCWSLSAIVVENGVKEIEDEAFSECYNLRHVEIPDSVERVGNLVFKDCRALESVRLPERLREGCERLFNKYARLPRLYS